MAFHVLAPEKYFKIHKKLLSENFKFKFYHHGNATDKAMSASSDEPRGVGPGRVCECRQAWRWVFFFGGNKTVCRFDLFMILWLEDIAE